MLNPTGFTRLCRTLLFSSLLFACARTAYPCSCTGNNSVCAVYWDTQLLFRGRVTAVQFSPNEPPSQIMVNGKSQTVVGPGMLEVHFAVLEKLRGDVGSELVLHTPSQGSACGFPFAEGAEYLVYAYQQEQGTWWTNKCTRTHEIASAEQDRDLQWIHALAYAKSGGIIFGSVIQASPDIDIDGYKYQALPDITVHLKGPVDRTVETDHQGEFSLSGLAVGRYEVSPEFPDGLGPPTSSTVSVREKGCAEVHFTAQNDGVLDGNLLYSDMTPVAGAYIRLKRIAEANAPAWTQDYYVDTTDVTGHFHMEPVQPGSYVLGLNIDFPAYGSPYQRKNFYPGKSRLDQAEVIHIVGAQRVEGLRYVLPAGPDGKTIPVKVKVVAPNGTPASNASLTLWNPQWPHFEWGPQARSDSDGAHVIDLLEGEFYNLFAQVDGADGAFRCGGPVAVVPTPNLRPIVLVLDGSNRSCFDKHITQPPPQ